VLAYVGRGRKKAAKFAGKNRKNKRLSLSQKRQKKK
jgi:hypothetical protein